MANSTVLQIPNNLDDPVVLRRVLTLIVEQLDELKGNRGDDAAASSSQLVSTASNVDELRQDLNNLDNNYLRQDGKTQASKAVSYSKDISLDGRNFADVRTVNRKVLELEESLKDKFIGKEIGTAPTLLAGNTDTATISAKVDELIVLLIDINILS